MHFVSFRQHNILDTFTESGWHKMPMSLLFDILHIWGEYWWEWERSRHVFPPELPRSNWELSAGARDGCDACRAEKSGQDREHRPVSHWCPLPRGHILVSTTSLGHPWGVECGAVALRRINLTNKLESESEVTWVCMKLEITRGWSRNKTLLTRRWEIMRWLLVQIIHKL